MQLNWSTQKTPQSTVGRPRDSKQSLMNVGRKRIPSCPATGLVVVRRPSQGCEFPCRCPRQGLRLAKRPANFT
jgi:hypothetical protein